MSEPITPASDAAAPAIRRDGTVLGFDVGSRRIGVAIGSAFAAHARAVAVVDVHGNGPDWTAIERLLKEWKPDGLVVGDPLTLDGQDQPNRKRAQGFARQLQERFKLPVVMIDERSSSVEAARRFAVERAEGRKRRRDAAALDAVAAAVIIDRWLSSPDDATPIP
ncbi:Holliday junction resolvase RuvX [Stenotrophomonas sp. PSU_St99]